MWNYGTWPLQCCYDESRALMIDGLPLVDVHLHVARRPTLKPAWKDWADDFGDEAVMRQVYDRAGTADPGRLDDYLAAEGVDVALLMTEYSPKVTGIQPIEDVLPLAAGNPARIEVIANVNPHLHYPVDEELQRQLDLGAVALKVHPVHAGVAANDPALYPAYEVCQQAGIPLVAIVLAHGGRGWWYDAAAFMALSSERVWIELSGLPPSRLREYYARHNWRRLARRMIFGTDWPGVPGIAANARAVAAACPDEETAALVLAGNAAAVYNLKLPEAGP